MDRKPHEIENALFKLEKNLNTCIPYSCFGDDNRKQIIVMLDVIKNNRTKLWINSTYLTPSQMFHEQPDNLLWQSAIDATEWLQGNFDIEELLFKELSVASGKLLAGVILNR